VVDPSDLEESLVSTDDVRWAYVDQHVGRVDQRSVKVMHHANANQSPIELVEQLCTTYSTVIEALPESFSMICTKYIYS
jgi:hypothetical protein